MRSRRSAFELWCRIAAFALLGWLLGASLIPSHPIRVERATSATIGQRLASWTRMPHNAELHADFATVPPAWTVDWLAALRHSGHVVGWSGSPAAALLAVERAADPEHHVRIEVAAQAGAPIVLRDDASLIDSLRATVLGATVTSPLVIGAVRASVAGQALSIVVPPPLEPHAAYVVGQAGWEGKYLIAALEERGWPVVARLAVAPGVDVTQGPPQLDTSRVSVVIALDTTVARLGDALVRFVRGGGGLVLAGSAAEASNVRAIAPGALGARIRVAIQPAQSISLGSTGFLPIVSLAPDAVPLERRDGAVTIAARRVAAGRVIEVGYDDTWRWRMAGGDGSVDAHRAWWSRIVASVAYVPAAAERSPSDASAAPLAYVARRLGARAPVTRGSAGVSTSPVIIVTLIMVCLLSEWASRRLRGLR